MRLLSLNASTPTIKQGEFNSSAAQILVPLDMRGYNLFLVFELPSGEKVFTPSILLDANNMVSYALPAAVLSEIGRVQVELQGFVETSYIKSVTYSFTVVKSLTGPTNGTGTELKKEDYLPWFTEAAGFKSEVELIADKYRLDEMKRGQAETLRISKEVARVAGESARVIAENNRIESEEIREDNESIRTSNEGSRTSAEGSRVTAEGSRVTAEGSRVTAEGSRVTAEALRVTAESERAAALALKADKIRATNLITNGDFSQGTAGWNGIGAVVAGVAEKTATSQYGNINVSIPPAANYKNRVLYGSALIKSDSSLVSFGITDGVSNTFAIYPGDSTFKTVSLIKKMSNSTTAFTVKLEDLRANGFTKFYLDNVVIIDLTAVFGAGNEPTKEEMDRLLSKYPNSWFDGTQELISLKEVYTEKADTMKAENLVTNGDFSNGTTGWNVDNATLAVTNKILSVTSGGISSYSQAYQTSPSKKFPIGSKLYAKAKLRVTNSVCTALQLMIAVGNNFSKNISLPVINQWYEISDIFTTTSDTGTFAVKPTHAYADSATANGKVMEINGILVIDLTKIFGAGNEPNKEQMDALLLKYPNSWFDGITDLVSVSDLMNGKASRTQEGWITPTLLNGWVNSDVANSTVGYYKDTVGVIHLKGIIKNGTTGSNIFVLPVGYRPQYNSRFAVGANSLFGQLIVVSTGELVHSVGSNNNFSLDGITFRPI